MEMRVNYFRCVLKIVDENDVIYEGVGKTEKDAKNNAYKMIKKRLGDLAPRINDTIVYDMCQLKGPKPKFLRVNNG